MPKHNKNCPNCGMPIDYELDKCEYCGTSYFDLSCMPMDEPFYLRFIAELPPYGDRQILAKVILRDVTITMAKDEFPSMALELTCLNLRSEEK